MESQTTAVDKDKISQNVAAQRAEEIRKEKEQQKKNVQTLVTVCLEKKQKLLLEKRKLEETLRVVNMDLEDLKEGRLDRILERQVKDPRSAEISEFMIKEQESSIGRDGKWYKPYVVTFAEPRPDSHASVVVNCSATKDFAVGTYIIGPNKEVIHFRN